MFLFVFARAKRRSGEIAKFQFLILPNDGVATFSLKKVPESAGDSGNFLFIYFAVLSLVFELKQNLEAQPYTEMNSQPPKRVELLWISMGKIISSLYSQNKT